MRNDCKGFFLRYGKEMILAGMAMLALIEGFYLKEEPIEFGVSGEEMVSQGEKKWRWIIGKEGWYYLPPNAKKVTVDLMNYRGDSHRPMEVTIDIPGMFVKKYQFDGVTRSFREIIPIDRSETRPKRINVRCSSTWSPSTVKGNKDYRRLCIFTAVRIE